MTRTQIARANFEKAAAIKVLQVCRVVGPTHRSVVYGQMDLFVEKLSEPTVGQDSRKSFTAVLAHYLGVGQGVLSGDPEMLIRVYPDEKLLIPYRLNRAVREDDLFAGAEVNSPDHMARYLGTWFDKLAHVGHGVTWDS